MFATGFPTIIRFRRIEGTPVGPLLLGMSPRGLRYLLFTETSTETSDSLPSAAYETWKRDSGQLDDVVVQLMEWFSGTRTTFDIPLDPVGTDFLQRVWDKLKEIPWGHTTSYGEIARRIGQPSASRAVGMANGRNPISIIVPCHRVIGCNGQLTGYGGGLERKQALLRLEGSWPLVTEKAKRRLVEAVR